jgi:hypothetical protein
VHATCDEIDHNIKVILSHLAEGDRDIVKQAACYSRPARICAVRENLNEAHVFITERGGPMTTVGFHHLIRPLGEAAGIPSRCARTC